MATASLAYRKSEAGIWAGRVPEKYTRLLPYITGTRILEFGAAEGVLSLLLAERVNVSVVALEQNPHRHATAVALQRQWKALGRRVEACTMVQGDIRDHLLDGIETVVAIRVIYHLGDGIEDVFAAIARAGVSTIVLGGNPNRVKRSEAGTGDPYDFFAGVTGMTYALERAGYRIRTVVREGDPIVVGGL